MSQEKTINLANKLYESRRTCRQLYGEKWKEEITFHTNLIHIVMKRHNFNNELKATLRIITEYDGDKTETGFAIFTMKLMAAAVEIIEPLNK